MTNRRRRYEPEVSNTIPRTRARLGRMMFVLASVILLTAFGLRLNAPDSSELPSPTPAATGTTAAGVVALERRTDGWYLARPEAWPLVDVERIIDGDTLDVRAAGTGLRVRVFGIDTPERGERCYTEATEQLGKLAGRSVRLVADARQQDSGGRELRYVFTPEGRSVDAALLDAGLAQAWREDGKLRDALVGIEANAKAAHRGCLWTS
jgi:endonuclease YncB( thermonuclease family)